MNGWKRQGGAGAVGFFGLSISLMFCLFANQTWAFLPIDVKSDSLFLLIQKQLPESNPDAQRFIDSLKTVGGTTGDCLLIQVASAFHVKRNAPNLMQMASIVNEHECEIRGYHVQYNYAVRYFLLKQYGAAKDWFERALSASDGNEKRLRCHLAIGACCNELGDAVRALDEFKSAHDLAKPPVEPMLINNLAASQIGMGLEVEALEMLEMALTRQDLDAYTRTHLEFNRFHALASLNDLAQAKAAFQRISGTLKAETLQASQFKSLIRYCLIQETQDEWLQLKTLLSDVLSHIDHKLLFDEGDPTPMLFEAYDDRWSELQIADVEDVRWRTVKNLHRTYFEGRKAYAKSLLEERNALAKVNFSPKSIVLDDEPNYWLLFGGPLLLMLIGGVSLLQWKKNQKQSPAAQSSEQTVDMDSKVMLLEQVERIAKEGEPNSNLQALISDLRSGEIEKHQARIEEITESLDLSAIEKQALALFVHGYSGKQVAKMLDRSPGYMYNMRSKLRKCLSLKESEDFPDWYRLHSGKEI